MKIIFSLLTFFALSILPASAQLSIGAGGSVKPCDDFATNEFADAWDMSNTDDIVNFTASDLVSMSNPSFSNGIFSSTSTLTAGGHFHFLSPQITNLEAVGGRWGQHHPIDVAKYTHFTVRMALAQNDSTGGFKLLWNRGTGYTTDTTYTALTKTVPGWKNYTIDLTSIGIDGASLNSEGWLKGKINSFALFPTLLAQSFQVDYARLEDPNSCGSVSVPYTATATSTAPYHSIYVDDDSNPFNGYLKKLVSSGTAAGASSVSVSALGLEPGSKQVVGIAAEDYATLERDDSWDMSEQTDLLTYGGLSGASFSGGSFNATLNGSAAIYLAIPSDKPINVSKYKKLSIKLTKAARSPINIFWSGGGAQTLTPAVHDADNDSVYTFDISTAQQGGASSVSEIVIVPTGNNGDAISLHFVALQANNYTTTDTLPTGVTASSAFIVKAPPIAKVLQPDLKGGEAYKPWNSVPDDLDFALNLRTDADPAHTGEKYTTYLPDVRLVDGVRGDFFKGTNIAGNDDPNDFYLFPFTPENPGEFDADQYHRICLKMALDREFDLGLGSVTKFFYGKVGGDVEEADAWATIYDRWSSNKWYEYCFDATNHPRENTGEKTWGGTLNYFRIDPHEFHESICCDNTGNPFGDPISVTYYTDYLKIRKDDRANGKYTIVFSATDNDTGSLTKTFFYNTAKSTSGATQISNTALTCEGDVCIWDVAGVPSGKYFIISQFSDGTSTSTAFSSGPVIIDQTSSPAALSPKLEIQAPSSGATVCSALQFKGFALNENRFEDVSAIQAFVDGTHFATFFPGEYSLQAKAAYPSADSSNAGFDEFHSVTGLSTGSHSLIVKAYASDGQTVSVGPLSFTKSSGCSDPTPVVDPNPSGSPVDARVTVGSGNDPTPDPTAPPSTTAPTLAAKHAASGTMTVTVKKVAEGCTLSLYGGANAQSVSSLIKQATVTKAQAAKNTVVLVHNNVAVNKKKVKSVSLRVDKICSGATASSSVVGLKFKTTAGASKVPAVLKKLKGLKAQVKKKK